jgi:hypothetical protein
MANSFGARLRGRCGNVARRDRQPCGLVSLGSLSLGIQLNGRAARTPRAAQAAAAAAAAAEAERLLASKQELLARWREEAQTVGLPRLSYYAAALVPKGLDTACEDPGPCRLSRQCAGRLYLGVP